MVSFLHAADLHLDSPLRGLSRYQGAPVEALREATRRALENLVALALERSVDFVVIAGDLYDGDWKDYNTAQFLVRQLSRLDRAGIPVVVISGNHDAQSRLTRQLNLPPNVRTLSTQQAETVVFEHCPVAVHGQGFERPEVTVDLSANYPPPRAGLFNIGLLHTSADGREGHARYAPCTVEALAQHGYDYWALGHVHRREVLWTAPHIVFPGNTQGRHIREEGEKGATLVRVEDGRVVELSHHPLDVVRWYRLQLDLEDAEHPDEVLGELRARLESALREAEQRLVAVRVELIGAGLAWQQMVAEQERWIEEVRAQGHQASGDVWIEKVRFLPGQRPHQGLLPGSQDVLASLLQGVHRLRQPEGQPELLELARGLFAKLDGQLPREWKEEPDGVRLLSAEFLQELLDEAAPLLEAKLRKGELG